MTKKKQQEINNHVEAVKEAQLAFKLAYLDLIDESNQLIQVCSTDEVLNLKIEEPEEDVEPMTLDLKEAIVDDIIKEKGDIL
jgi:Mg/Co/Ni transporter MgtE